MDWWLNSSYQRRWHGSERRWRWDYALLSAKSALLGADPFKFKFNARGWWPIFSSLKYQVCAWLMWRNNELREEAIELEKADPPWIGDVRLHSHHAVGSFASTQVLTTNVVIASSGHCSYTTAT